MIFMPESNPQVNQIIADLNSDCPVRRAKATSDAQHLLWGPVTEAPARRLVDQLVRLIEIGDDGRPRVPCEHARERAIYALVIAHEGGHDMTPHLGHIKAAAERDPHVWVRDAANEAIGFHKNHNPLAPTHNLIGSVGINQTPHPHRRVISRG